MSARQLIARIGLGSILKRIPWRKILRQLLILVKEILRDVIRGIILKYVVRYAAIAIGVILAGIGITALIVLLVSKFGG